MLGALVEVSRRYPVSVVNLPFACGLALIRVEESVHPAVVPFAGLLPMADPIPNLFPVLHPVDAGSAGLETGIASFWALGRKIEWTLAAAKRSPPVTPTTAKPGQME